MLPALLVSAVQHGDILLFRGWYDDDPANTNIAAIYAEAHPAPAVTSAATASADTGAPFSYTITASNQPVQFSATGLPAGLTLNTTTGIISGTPLVSGNVSIALGAASIWGTGQQNLALVLRSQMDIWRAQKFPGLGNTGAAASNANPDGDAFNNLLEFAFGLDPSVRDAATAGPQMVTITDSTGSAKWFAIAFRRRTSIPRGADYIIEESSDLVTWQTVDQATQQVGVPVPVGVGTELVTIRSTHPLGTGQWFLRLRVVEQ